MREGGLCEVDYAGFGEGFLGGGRDGVQLYGVFVVAVRGEGWTPRLVDVGAHGGPADGVGEGLKFAPFGVVPDLEGLAEAGRDTDQCVRFGEDGVRADEVFAGARLDLDVEGHFDGGEIVAG